MPRPPLRILCIMAWWMPHTLYYEKVKDGKMGFRIWKCFCFCLEEGSAHTHNLQACLGCPWGGGEELLGNGLALGQAGGAQHRAGPVLVNDHGGPGVHPGAIDDSLPQLLHIPGGDWLRVSQFGGKYLDRGEKRRGKNTLFNFGFEL